MQQGRFASLMGAKQRKNFALIELKSDLIDGGQSPEPVGQLLCV